MPSFQLTPKDKDKAHGQWTVEWDSEILSLQTPDAQTVFKLPLTDAHREFDVYDLFLKERVTIVAPLELPEFSAEDFAIRSLRNLVEEGYRRDDEGRRSMQRGSLILCSVLMLVFVIGVGLFSLYCWWASWAPDPPPGHWLRWVAPFIHFGLMVLIAVTLAVPFIAWRQLREYFLLGRFE